MINTSLYLSGKTSTFFKREILKTTLERVEIIS